MWWCSAERFIIHRYFPASDVSNGWALRVCVMLNNLKENWDRRRKKKRQRRWQKRRQKATTKEIHSIFWIGILQCDYRLDIIPNSVYKILFRECQASFDMYNVTEWRLRVEVFKFASITNRLRCLATNPELHTDTHTHTHPPEYD